MKHYNKYTALLDYYAKTRKKILHTKISTSSPYHPIDFICAQNGHFFTYSDKHKKNLFFDHISMTSTHYYPLFITLKYNLLTTVLPSLPLSFPTPIHRISSPPPNIIKYANKSVNDLKLSINCISALY